ncbi:unnamed protein product [Protopolystoma xenopodis]|uniref:Uncharacterized protein n=1 Tax=Protopolystoma xenopodis TaxID=117903 RepID=A0A448WQC4_9PLAT|nr:unnamed protein product [Protopolystoma xenopodis]
MNFYDSIGLPMHLLGSRQICPAFLSNQTTWLASPSPRLPIQGFVPPSCVALPTSGGGISCQLSPHCHVSVDPWLFSQPSRAHRPEGYRGAGFSGRDLENAGAAVCTIRHGVSGIGSSDLTCSHSCNGSGDDAFGCPCSFNNNDFHVIAGVGRSCNDGHLNFSLWPNEQNHPNCTIKPLLGHPESKWRQENPRPLPSSIRIEKPPRKADSSCQVFVASASERSFAVCRPNKGMDTPLGSRINRIRLSVSMNKDYQSCKPTAQSQANSHKKHVLSHPNLGLAKHDLPHQQIVPCSNSYNYSQSNSNDPFDVSRLNCRFESGSPAKLEETRPPALHHHSSRITSSPSASLEQLPPKMVQSKCEQCSAQPQTDLCFSPEKNAFGAQVQLPNSQFAGLSCRTNSNDKNGVAVETRDSCYFRTHSRTGDHQSVGEGSADHYRVLIRVRLHSARIFTMRQCSKTNNILDILEKLWIIFTSYR